VSTLRTFAGVRQDGYENELTGIGTSRDKTRAATFELRTLTGTECEWRWRGSDLGRRIVEVLPDEMLRAGWDLQVQPQETNRADSALLNIDDEGPRIAEAMEGEWERLNVAASLRQALCFERAYGGGGVIIGADDGATNLAQPLVENAIRSIRHLTPVTGGLDGELVAYSYYTDPASPKWGLPETYQLRNQGVSSVPSPVGPAPVKPLSPSPVLLIHESRILAFDGQPASRRARREMHGWGDSIFTRVDQVLADYQQTWGGVANLLQDFAQGVLKIDGLAAMLAADAPGADGAVVKRAVQIDMARSIARVMLLDSNEEFKREVTPLAGIADILREFALRLAAASDMPYSLLMGQVQGGLGNAGDGDLRFFYDRVSARQRDRLLPKLQRLMKLCFLAKEGPTKGVEPARWSFVFRPLWQPNATEQAEIRLKQSQTDVGYVNAGILSPEEVAASRFGGSKYSTDTVLDLEGRKKASEQPEEPDDLPDDPPPDPQVTP